MLVAWEGEPGGGLRDAGVEGRVEEVAEALEEPAKKGNWSGHQRHLVERPLQIENLRYEAGELHFSESSY